ncbi:MAG: NAD(P)-dependent oxidoreductase [Pseudomonadota bacterium]
MNASFVGLGAMGAPMASNCLRAGLALTVFDINPEPVERLRAEGAATAASLAEAASGSDLVITMLPATAQVLEVITGPEGLLRHLQPGAAIMEMSTIAPEGSDQVAAACAEAGVRFLDAPVGRLVSHAIAGESLFMVGCSCEALFALVQPYLDAMGTTIIRCGGAGSGVRAKLVNNFQLLTIAQVTAEALVLAERLGLEIATVKEINAATTAANGQMQVNFASKVLAGDTEPGFTIDLAHKDMGLALEAAAQARLGLPVGAAAHSVYGSARGSAFAGRDFSALLDYAAELAGLGRIRLGETKAIGKEV